MGTIKKYNPETGQWEIYGSTDAKDINLIDVGNNFEDKSVEGAFREVSDKLNQTLAELEAHKGTLIKHASNIEWLKENGGGGGGNQGAAAPTITSTFENCTVDKETEIKIPIFFSSPNLGQGTAYVIINNVEVASITGIKQGNNTINIGKLTESRNEISIYVKDRVNLLSNQLTWIVTAGGVELSIDFDDTADYYISDLITMQYYVTTASDLPLKAYMTIDYDSYEIDCKNGFNEYEFPAMGIGVHKFSMYVSDGAYTSSTYNFNIVIVNSNSLYVSSTFKGGEFEVGNPVAIQYRVSKASNESFTVNLYLNDKLHKTLSCTPGAYYWTLNDLDIDHYKAKIEVSGAYDEPQIIELEFDVIASDYTPLKVATSGLIYRLSAKGRTNQDSDRENPVDDSGNGIVATLHNFNYFSNGWIDGELVCDGSAYVEIDMYPYLENAIHGSTIEINYTALDIGFTDSRILDYTDVNTPYKGIYVDIEDAAIKSLNNTGIVTTDKDRELTLSFVIDRKNKFAKIFIDGICSRAFTLSDSGSGTSATREDFTHVQKIFLNSKKGLSNFGACKIKDFRVYNRALSDDEIVSNYIAQISNLKEQEAMFNFNFDNKTLPQIRMYGDTSNMTLETPVSMRIKYTSPDEDKYGQSFDLPYCQVNWQGTSSLQYVLKNFTARLKDENMAVYEYSPYVNGVKEDTYCFKCDYMESTHSRNVGIAKFVNDCLYDTKNPAQMKDPNIRNSVNGFPCLMYINDELQGVYNFNLDRYSTKSFGYTDPDKVLVYEISANSDTTAGAFYSWTESSGKEENSYYKSDFECLYPPTRAAGNDNLTELKRLIEWVDKSSDEDFKDNIGRYFNLEYLLRYYLNVLVFGLVDSLGKNAKITSFDGGLTWYFQFYDSDTSIGLNNSGFLLFGSDIEMGDENVFNTTGSRLWQRVVLLFQEELKAQYALMRQDRFTVDNIMKYLYDEQISKIPATYYNKDMQAKYLNFGSSYLYALHGNSEHHIRKWIKERIMYVDTLLGYMVSSSDYITIRANKLGPVYLDIEMYQPMYVTVKWRDESDGSGIQTRRVGKGEKVRFEYSMPTATDQEVLVYCGKNIKSLGDLSNLQPSTLLIANANRLTEIECHSPNLINTDLSECVLLQKIDISDCTALGTGIGAQPILNIQKAKYLKYLDTRNTQITSIYTMQSGSNLEEIYYPSSIQSIQLSNQAYLKIVGIPYDDSGDTITYCENLADVEFNNCKNIEYLTYPYDEGDYVNLKAIKQVQNFKLISSLDRLEGMSFKGFNKLKTLTLSSMHNITSLGFDDMLETTDEANLEAITIVDCPLIDSVSFNISNNSKKIAFGEDSVVDLSGVQSIKTISSNASIKGLNTLKIPTSTKELKFTAEYGDGKNEIINIWSGTANHASDGFIGMDLLDVDLTYLDMGKLTNITNAINFNISPTTQNPNMNTYRDENFFRPQGRLDLSNYEGDMTNMLKGVDLSLLEVIVDKNRSQVDLIGVFEKAVITQDKLNVVNNLLEKFNNSTNWTNLFKDSDLDLTPSQISIPTDRDINLTGMFYNTKVNEDIVIPSNVVCAINMFRDCINIKEYKNNWDNLYYIDTFTADKCYWGTGGDLEVVPVPWGGYGFFDNVTTEIIVNVPRAGYEVTLANRYRTLDHGIVNWGDGIINNLKEVNYRHTFVNPGTYTIKGHFTFGKEYICATNLNSILTEVTHIASDSVNLNQAFKYCSKLTTVNLNGLKPTTAKELFASCVRLETIAMDDFNTENLNTTYGLFSGCEKLTSLDLSSWTTNKITNMGYMFNGCNGLLELKLDGWDTGSATNMEYMFSNCSKLQQLNIGHFNTENVSTMVNMFYNCQTLTELDVSGFDTSSVVIMDNMFSSCKKLLTLDVSNWTNEQVTSMNSIFSGCNNIIGIRLDNFGTDNVTNLGSMFSGCEKLTSLDMSNFNTEKVVNMDNMFYGCKGLTELDISGFNTANAENMSYMFAYCIALPELNVSNFVTSKATNMMAMFYDCKSLTELDVSGFDTVNVTDMRYMFYNCNNLLSLNLESFNTSNVLNMNGMFSGCKSLSEIDVSKFEVDKVTDISYMFYDCEMIVSLNVSNWVTQSVTNMSYFCTDCINLSEIDVSKWNVTRVTNMSHIFDNCKSLITLDVSSWSTDAVINMESMFNNCERLTDLDVSNFNTSKVTSMKFMFGGCLGLTRLVLTNFDTSNVENMDSIFYGDEGLVELDVSNWITSKVVNMNAMFYGCKSLFSLNVSSFDTGKVTVMKNMFNGCVDLINLDLSNFVTSNVTDMSHMFSNCRSLTSLDLNHFDTNKVTSTSYMFRYCTCPIVFTDKTNNALVTTSYMFYDYLGSSVDLTNFSIRNATKNEYVIKAPNLVDLIAPTNISSNFQVMADNLSVDSLMSIINNLLSVSIAQELEIGSKNIAKLTDEQIAIAINKNWTVC